MTNCCVDCLRYSTEDEDSKKKYDCKITLTYYIIYLVIAGLILWWLLSHDSAIVIETDNERYV